MMTSNRPEFVAVVHGASKVGVAPVLLNPAWKAIGGGRRVPPDLAKLRGGGR